MKDNTTVTFKALNEQTPAALYRRYNGQIYPQPVHIYLDPYAGELYADYSGEFGGGVPMDVHQGRRLRWQINMMTTSRANALMEQILPLAQSVADGFSTRWDGSNYKGELDQTAQEAAEKIAEACRDTESDLSVIDAADYFAGCGPDCFGVTAESTENDLEVLAVQELDYAMEGGIFLEGTFMALRDIRDRLREKAEDSAEG